MESHTPLGIAFPTNTDTARGMDARPREGDPVESESSDQPGYSIAAVSKLTGINCHTLRVWERRYGFPAPERSPAGHRRYSRGEVRTLCRLIHLNRTSRRQIGELIADWRCGTLAREAGLEIENAQSEVEPSADLVRKLLAGDQVAAEHEYQALADRFEPERLVEQVIGPALVEAGDGWFRGSYSVSQERQITVFLRRKLSLLIDAAARANTRPARSVIVGTVQGDRHEGGVLAFSLAMELRGWQVHNLGADLPVREFRSAAQRLSASALALSFILSRNIKKRFQELEQVRALPVFVGGRSIVNYQSLARCHGLIPLVGPFGKTADLFVTEFDEWSHSMHKSR